MDDILRATLVGVWLLRSSSSPGTRPKKVEICLDSQEKELEKFSKFEFSLPMLLALTKISYHVKWKRK